MIRECIVTTLSEEGRVHIAPLGLIATTSKMRREAGSSRPFRPSTTLDNLRATPFAVASFTDDVLVFAGCLTGRKDWPTRPATHVPGVVLDGALAHAELKVERIEEDEQRPRFHCRVVHQAMHAPFLGFNRAQGAVIEAAILATPPAYAAAREGRARARLSPDRRGEDRRPPRARGLAALDREDRGPLQARVAQAALGPLSRMPLRSTSPRSEEGTMSEIREVTGTAFVVAEFRARENEEPHPLYVDPIVRIFLDARTRAAADAIRADFPAGENMPRLRTRYYDDRLGEQIAQGCRQVVILGAGLDTRAVRKRAPGVAYFEIDDAGTLELEEGALRGEQDRCAGDLHPRQLRRLRRDPAARERTASTRACRASSSGKATRCISRARTS